MEANEEEDSDPIHMIFTHSRVGFKHAFLSDPACKRELVISPTTKGRFSISSQKNFQVSGLRIVAATMAKLPSLLVIKDSSVVRKGGTRSGS